MTRMSAMQWYRYRYSTILARWNYGKRWNIAAPGSDDRTFYESFHWSHQTLHRSRGNLCSSLIVLECCKARDWISLHILISRIGDSCMNSFGTSPDFGDSIWGKTSRDGPRKSSTWTWMKLLPRVERKRPLLEVVLEWCWDGLMTCRWDILCWLEFDKGQHMALLKVYSSNYWRWFWRGGPAFETLVTFESWFVDIKKDGLEASPFLTPMVEKPVDESKTSKVLQIPIFQLRLFEAKPTASFASAWTLLVFWYRLVWIPDKTESFCLQC